MQGCVFLANSAYIQACIMWVTLIPSLFKFNRYAKARYGEAVSHMCAPLPPACSSLGPMQSMMILIDICDH